MLLMRENGTLANRREQVKQIKIKNKKEIKNNYLLIVLLLYSSEKSSNLYLKSSGLINPLFSE